MIKFATQSFLLILSRRVLEKTHNLMQHTPPHTHSRKIVGLSRRASRADCCGPVFDNKRKVIPMSPNTEITQSTGKGRHLAQWRMGNTVWVMGARKHYRCVEKNIISVLMWWALISFFFFLLLKNRWFFKNNSLRSNMWLLKRLGDVQVLLYYITNHRRVFWPYINKSATQTLLQHEIMCNNVSLGFQGSK